MRTGVLLVCLALLGCGPSAVSLGPPSTSVDAEHYDEIRERWTRSADEYDGFESRVFVYATYWGPELTAAWLARYEQLFEPLPEDLARLRKERKAATTEAHEVFVALYTNERAWNDLEREEPAFRLWLGNDAGQKVAPLSIERVRDRNGVTAAFFPYLSHFRTGYHVRFPLTTAEGLPVVSGSARRFHLMLTGPMAQVTLTWEIARPR